MHRLPSPAPLHAGTLAAVAAALVAGCAPPDLPPGAESAANRADDDHAALQRGRAALTRFQCGACHAIPGVPTASSPWGPSLADRGRRSYIAGHLPNDEAHLVAWIRSPQAWAPGTVMPDMGVPPAVAQDMARYLLWLR